MKNHAVVIAGAGPTGMMLGAELKLAGVDVAIVEPSTTKDREGGSRAGGLHARTIEVFDMRGIADRFISQGQTAQTVRFANAVLDISDFPTRHPYGLALFQIRTERILADWIDELHVQIYRGLAVTGFVQDDRAVDVALSDGSTMRAEFLVGCDGGRSVVRKTAGIAFVGSDPTMSWLIAEVQMSEEPAWGFRETTTGWHAIGRGDNGVVRLALTDPELKSGEPTLRDLSETLSAIYGTDFGVHSPNWLSRFNDATRQAVAYRDRRVLLAGDAAHIHPPLGGQGLNIGVQDAMNLGWKLAQVVKGISPENLLDSYHAERHPVGARVLKNTMAQVATRRTDDRTKALNDYVAELLGADESRKRLAAEMSGLGVHYDLGEGHPLLGRRMPDLDLVTGNGSVRVFTLLHGARPVVINFGERGSVDITPWSDRVQLIDAKYDGTWELPVIGAVAAPTSVLIRPDGYVAWVGEATQGGLTDALTTWFGSGRIR
ncbi:MAG TPA: FAD-dependent monooxygenase [Gemmatimonadaceae bacterium]|nr:FAD-dependent monooxygenase [Gemmatimonadaceae bacterium]